MSQQRNQHNRHQGVTCRNFLPTRYTVVLTFDLKPLNSSCMHLRNMASQGHPAWERIYANKSFLELQSILHRDPLGTLWFWTLPLVNDQLFSLLYRMLLLEIRHYVFHVASTVFDFFLVASIWDSNDILLLQHKGVHFI